jgi:hypothetical protein
MHSLSDWFPILNLLLAVATLVLIGIYTSITARISRAAQDQVEASQKPVIVLRIAARGDRRDEMVEQLATKQPPQSVRVAITGEGFFEVLNIGTGPALNLSFDFVRIPADPDAPNRYARRLSYLQPGASIAAPIRPEKISYGDHNFIANYESLSGKKYVTEMVLHARAERAVLIQGDWKFKQAL